MKKNTHSLDPQRTIYLIDGSSLLYRGYYGMRPLYTSQGVPVQAVFTFCRMIKRILDVFKPHYIALVWDSKGTTARHEIYEEYKATREAPPNDLFEQKDKIVEFAELIGMYQVQQEGVEADDLMYSIAREQLAKKNHIVFVTSDKDMGQVLTDGVYIFNSFKDELIDRVSFEQKMGFSADRLPLFYGLVGDASDNIPGVRGIGKKIATHLAVEFSSMEDLYNRLHDVQNVRIRTILEIHKKEAFLSEELFQLRYYKTSFNKKDFIFDIAQWHHALPFFQELEFKSLLKEAGQTAAQRIATLEQKITYIKNTYRLYTVTTFELLNTVVEQLKNATVYALDTETDGQFPLQANLVGISFCMQEGVAYYIPCGHMTGEVQLSRDEVLRVLKPVLEDPKTEKCLHNAKYDQLVFSHYGIEISGMIFDSMIAANLLVQDWQSVGLKNLSSYYFEEQMLLFNELVKQRKLKNFSYVPLDQATYYSAFDAHQTYKLYIVFRESLKKEKLDQLFYTIELPLVQILYRMEKEGIRVESSILKKLGVQVEKALLFIKADIESLIQGSHKKINLNSPKQIEQLLFVQLKLPPQKKSAKGTGYSTDQEVLQHLATMHPVPGLIIKYRELFKLKSTYIDALPEYINVQTGCVHTSFSQTQVATGRLSSSNPNLQNIPADATGFGIQIRAAFKPKEGHVFISADYSQIELRVLAYLSQDNNLVQAFLKGYDIHAQTAARLFDIPLTHVVHEQRQIGKRINFSILYGLTPYGLSKDLDISVTDAKMYIEKYFDQYPHVSEWMEEIVAFTKKHGYVKTYWGRRRHIPAIYEKNKVLYEEARRIAINTVAQGTAAEIVKQGMIALDNVIRKRNIDAQMLLQIHDELLMSVSKQQKDEVEQLMKSILESIVDWNVPLIISTRIGADWKEVTK